MKEETELVWLPKSLAKKVKALENSDNFVQEFIDESERDIKASLEVFDDEVIQYKAAMIKARDKFREVKDAELDANYALWEKFEDEKKSLQRMVAESVQTLKPLVDELNKVSELMDKIDHYKIERFLDMLKSVQGYLYGENKEILKFLIDNYKRE